MENKKNHSRNYITAKKSITDINNDNDNNDNTSKLNNN